MHDYEKGHTCPTCGKSGIPCTIEDGFCENDGECDNCIKERDNRQLSLSEYLLWEYRIGGINYEREEPDYE